MANKRLNAVITIGGAIAGSFTSATGSAKKRMLEIGSAVDAVKRRQQELNRVIADQERLGRAGSALRVQYAQQELAQLDKKLAKLRQVQSLEQRRQANAADRGRLQGNLIGAAVGTAMVAAPVIGATKSAADFQYQLRLIGNTADMSAAEVLRLGQSINAISQRTAQGATTVQKAMGFLIAAGMDAKTAEAMLENIARTATATGGDIEDIARAAFTLNDSMKIAPGKEMAAALDTLAQAGKEGNVELKDMAKVLPVLGSGMVALKMQGREAAATMGAALEIARKGAADADEAANNMKNYIAKIMSPETLKKAKKEFGLDLYKIITDAQKGGKNPFEESMKAVMKVTGGDQKKIGELFTDMQVQNFIRPMIQNWDKYLEIKNKALAADGVISKDFDLNMKEAKIAMDRAGQAAERFGIALGAVLLPAVTKVLDVFTPMMDTLADLATQNPVVAATVVGLAVGAGVLAVGLAAVGLAANLVVGGALAMLPVLKAVGAAILFVGRALLLNPIGIALTALGVAGFLLWKNWDQVKAGVVAVWEDLKRAFDVGSAWVMGKIQPLIDAVKMAKRAVGGLFSGGGGSVSGEYDAMGNYTGGPALPQPAMATGRGGGSSYTDSSKHEYKITQLPGEDAAALARRITEEQERQRAAKQRSALYDGAW